MLAEQKCQCCQLNNGKFFYEEKVTNGEYLFKKTPSWLLAKRT